MRKETSRDGEYLARSIALIVCLVTPTASASACCDISPAWKRSSRMRLVIRVLTQALRR
jgi:hypothetical protein